MASGVSNRTDAGPPFHVEQMKLAVWCDAVRCSHCGAIAASGLVCFYPTLDLALLSSRVSFS